MQSTPWLREYYISATSCDFTSQECWRINQNKLPLIHDDTQWFFEYYQVKAAAVFAAMLKKQHAQTCGSSSSDVCLLLKKQMRNNREIFQDALQGDQWNLEAEFSEASSTFREQTNVGFDELGEITSGERNGSVYNVFNYRACANSDFCFQQVRAPQWGPAD